MDYQLLALIIVTLVLFVDMLLVPRLKKVLTNEQIDMIDYACEKGVEFAEQMYLNGEKIDRREVAVSFAFEFIKESGIVPERYMDIIEVVVESKVFNLPKTHK